MTWFLSIVFITLGIVFAVSLVRWNLIKGLRESLEFSEYEIFDYKRVSAAAKLKAGETLGIPLNCTIAINQQELHLIPIKFHLLLFMTDFPFTFSKKANKKLKIQRSEQNEIVFVGKQRKSSIFGSELEITIQVYDEEERLELLKKIKSWK